MVYVVKDPFGDELRRFESQEEAHQYMIQQENIHTGMSFSIEEVASNDEPTNDDTTTMTDYGFFGDDDEQNDTTINQTTSNDGWNWDKGKHTMASGESRDSVHGAISETISELDSDIDDDMIAVLEDAQSLVEDTSVNDFECPHPDCGINHGHGEGKHNITDHHSPSNGIPGFNITPEFAEEIEFEANCHCGANEAAMLVEFLPYINIPMFKDQELFEGVFEVDPDILDDVYRLVQHGPEDGLPLNFNEACGRVAGQHGVTENEAIPLGVREDMKTYFERRAQMEEQANKAPIAQETRTVIKQRRDELEEAVNQ